MQFSENQFQEILTDALANFGLNSILENVLNCLMKLERKSFLSEKTDYHNKANGYRLGSATGINGKISLSIPRDRLGQFYPLVLSLIRDQEEELTQLAFNLYSKGLSTKDVSDIFTDLYGDSYSKSSISRMNQTFLNELEEWRNRPLEKNYPVIIIDALYSKVKRDMSIETEATYTVMSLREDMSRDIIAIEQIPTESASGWEFLLNKLKSRGMITTQLIVADGLMGLEQSALKVFPQASFQKCVVHFKRNILNHVRHSHKAEVADDIRDVFVTGNPSFSQVDGLNAFNNFVNKWGKIYQYIKNLRNNLSVIHYFTYLNYDYRIQSMIYTTNWIENLNKQFRRVLKIRNSMPSEDSLLLLLSKVAKDKASGYLTYPIYNFKFDKTLFNINSF